MQRATVLVLVVASFCGYPVAAACQVFSAGVDDQRLYWTWADEKVIDDPIEHDLRKREGRTYRGLTIYTTPLAAQGQQAVGADCPPYKMRQIYMKDDEIPLWTHSRSRFNYLWTVYPAWAAPSQPFCHAWRVPLSSNLAEAMQELANRQLPDPNPAKSMDFPPESKPGDSQVLSYGTPLLIVGVVFSHLWACEELAHPRSGAGRSYRPDRFENSGWTKYLDLMPITESKLIFAYASLPFARPKAKDRQFHPDHQTIHLVECVMEPVVLLNRLGVVPLPPGDKKFAIRGAWKYLEHFDIGFWGGFRIFPVGEEYLIVTDKGELWRVSGKCGERRVEWFSLDRSVNCVLDDVTTGKTHLCCSTERLTINPDGLFERHKFAGKAMELYDLPSEGSKLDQFFRSYVQQVRMK
jgi:hypothetical protein